MKGKSVPQLLLFPCNGNAVEALECITNEYEPVGFVDDSPHKQGTIHCGLPVFSRVAFTKHPKAKVLAVPGSPISYLKRNEIITGLGISPDRFATIIHPRATVASLAVIGINVLIMAGVVITSNAVIGDHVCILPNTVLHHDVVVGPLTLIGSNVVVAGNVAIGKNCYIGSGSRIINGVSIGERSLVGMGSTVLDTFPSEVTLVGSPARQIHRKHGDL